MCAERTLRSWTQSPSINFEKYLAKLISKHDAMGCNSASEGDVTDSALCRLAKNESISGEQTEKNLGIYDSTSTNLLNQETNDQNGLGSTSANFDIMPTAISFQQHDFSNNIGSSMTNHNILDLGTSMTDWVNQLIEQINILDSDAEKSSALKISLHQQTLPDTEVTLKKTETGWTLDFKTKSAFSYRQIDQYIDALEKRFKHRCLGAISTSLKLTN
jgi:hypothetical protein